MLFVEGDGAVALRVVHCASCGSVLFPPQHYGCERCGSCDDALTDTTVPARGRIHSFALVHRHARLETPFQIVEVLTDAGPIVRARLDDPAPAIGDAVVAKVRRIDGADVLVFVPEGIH
jgi:uncharacterized OB-fold protein